MKKWFEIIEEINRLKEIIKERSMIFQVNSKEEIAEFLNLPIKIFYFVHYNTWNEIYEIINDFRNKANKLYHTNQEIFEFQEIKKIKGNKTTNGDVWIAYKNYLIRTDLQTWEKVLDDIAEVIKREENR